MKLSHNKDWTEQNEIDIAEAVELTEQQCERLFEQNKAIVLSDKQSALFEAWQKTSSAAPDGGDKETPPADIKIAGNVLSHAIEMEKVIDGNAAIDARVRLTLNSIEETKKGSLILCQMLRTTYGPQRMAAFPEVGSPFKDEDASNKTGKTVYLPCDNPDRYTVQRKGKKPGTVVNEPHDFYSEYANRTPYGRIIQDALKAIDAARDVYENKKSYKTCDAYTAGNGEVIDFPTMSAMDVQSELSMWNKRASALAGQYRDAIKLDRAWTKLEVYPGINFIVAKKKDGSINDSRMYPITIQDKENPGDFDTYTPKSILNFDVELALANGGKYSDLMDTVGRGAQEADDTPLAERIKDVEQAAEYIGELAAWLEVSGNDTKLTVFLNKTDKAGKHVHDDELLSTSSLAESLDAIASAFNKRVASLKEKAELKTASK